VVAGTVIAPTEAVFVEATSATFSTDASRHVDNLNISLFGRNNAKSSQYTQVDNAIVTFGKDCTLSKFMLHKDAPKLYIPQNGNEYAVVSSGYEGEMPLCFETSEDGTYTLAVEIDNAEMSYLHLIDNLTGTDINLLIMPSYTFEAKNTDYASRFRLLFSNSELADDTFAFFNGSKWIVNTEGEATLQVIDMMGRILSSQQIDGQMEIDIKAASGVYIMRVMNENNVKVQKVLIN